ncbi:hypothetical protein C0Q70_11718 [Pomacea canaliculata]|uniref:SHSP domain-containing protein n=1 Tax=Pomacea canaliculata TaxID=400727 RepID=A0A2T7P6U3_POMCA|nr:protein lethal(2)essential for life-like [Pomacea canaliculata]PVD29121.1 hypothetical protein C0Q70_11718 [Pomacea canaliculata]
MSVLPYLWRDPWEESVIPYRPFTSIVDDFLTPWRADVAPIAREVQLINNDQEFRTDISVQQFKPEEINIKTKENRLIIHAKHEERPDEHGFIMREFTRQYVLPEDVDPATVTSSLSPDGVLTIKAPKKALPDAKERTIPITHEVSKKKRK